MSGKLIDKNNKIIKEGDVIIIKKLIGLTYSNKEKVVIAKVCCLDEYTDSILLDFGEGWNGGHSGIYGHNWCYNSCYWFSTYDNHLCAFENKDRIINDVEYLYSLPLELIDLPGIY